MGKKILNIIIIISFAVIVISFIISENYIFLNVGRKAEVPLSDPNSLVVDTHENIYIGLNYFSKVQVYDKYGNFKFNWEVEANTGAFFLEIIGDSIIANCERGEYTLKYDLNGRLLTKIKKKSKSFRTSNESFKSYTDKCGHKYEITGLLFPDVEKNGKIVIRQNIFLKILTFPDGLIVLLIDILILIILNHKLFRNYLFQHKSDLGD